MKVALFIQSLEGGGAERVVCNLANYLACSGHNVFIMMMCDHGIAYHLNNHVVVVHIDIAINFYKSNPLKLMRFIIAMRRMDVCIAFLASPILISLFLKPILKAKIICTERNYPPARYGEKLQKRLTRWAGMADAWIFQTKEQRLWYGNSVNDKKAYIIPNAINDAFLNVSIENVSRRKEIVTVGSLQEKKNHKLLIDAFSKISQQFLEYRLIIYGEGVMEDNLKEYCIELGLKDRVFFPGFSNDIPNVIKDASLFVLSSNVEGIPNALIEAMALGLPCISTRCAGGGAELLISDGINGLLTPVNDVDGLAEAIKRMLENEILRNRLGLFAKKISEKYSPIQIYGQWEKVIIATVKKHRG